MRLSSALVLAQILLLEQKYQAYADLAVDTIGPLLIRLEKSRPSGAGQEFFDLEWVNDLASMLSLLPLCAPEFLAKLPDAQIRAMAGRWKSLREKATTDQARYQIDLILAAAYKRLGRDKEYRETAERLQSTNATAQRFLSSTDISEAVKSLRRDWIPQWAR